MPEQWTGEVVGAMHNAGLTREQLAHEMGIGKAYMTMILRGKRHPQDAERRTRDALARLLEKNGEPE